MNNRITVRAKNMGWCAHSPHQKSSWILEGSGTLLAQSWRLWHYQGGLGDPHSHLLPAKGLHCCDDLGAPFPICHLQGAWNWVLWSGPCNLYFPGTQASFRPNKWAQGWCHINFWNLYVWLLRNIHLIFFFFFVWGHSRLCSGSLWGSLRGHVVPSTLPKPWSEWLAMQHPTCLPCPGLSSLPVTYNSLVRFIIIVWVTCLQ